MGAGMISPSETDIGRAVFYRQPYMPAPDRGIVIGFNEDVVFVRYDGDMGAKATRRDDLEWETIISASAGSSAGSGKM